MPSGLLHTRGLPFLCLEAALASVFGLNEFTLRLPAALFGIAGILAAYLLASSLFDRRVGLVTAALMVVSVWEVEMSRYGRFYAAWVGYRQVTESLGALEMAAPVTSSGVVGSPKGILSLLQETLGKHLILPHFEAIERLVKERPLAFFIVTAWVAVWVGVGLVRGCRRGGGRGRGLAILPMLAAAWAHQFAVLFILMLLYGVRYARSVKQLWQPPWQVLYTAAAGCLLFWAVDLTLLRMHDTNSRLFYKFVISSRVLVIKL